MSRPKGSKNKLKELIEKPAPVVEAPKPVEPVKEEPKEWKPVPKMGNIQTPSEAENICADCGHKQGLHYGGLKGWCNLNGCKCNEFGRKGE